MAYLLNIRRKYIPNGTITRRSIADASVTISANSFPYTGEPITPGVTVIVSGTVLSANVDYLLEYRDNVDVGQGKVVLTGIGDYYGMKEATFYITSGAMPSGSWDFDITKTVLNGQKDLSSVSSNFRSMNILPVKKDGLGTIMCSHGSSFYLSLLSWDESSASSMSLVDGTSHVSGFEYGGTTGDGLRFTFPHYGQAGQVYYQDVSSVLDVAPLKKEGATVVEGFGDGSKWSTPFYGFSSDGKTFYRTLYYGNVHRLLTAKLSSPFRIESVVPDSVSLAGVPVSKLRVSPDGKSAVSFETSGNNYFVKYSLSTAFDFSTATETGRISVGITNHNLFDIDASGTKLVSVTSDGHTFYVYDLSK